MLFFVDTVWHVVFAFSVFFAGFLLASSRYGLFRISSDLAAILYVWHSLLCLYYYYFSLTGGADSTNYFIYSLTYDGGIDYGTRGIVYFTSFLSAGMGMSYGNIFLVTNVLGSIGLLALASSIQEISPSKEKRIHRLSLILLFLPSISFWSSAIGKDSLTFMASGLLCWGILSPRKRYPVFLVATLLFLVARPHIAGIFLISLAIPAVLLSRASIAQKSILFVVLLPVATAGIVFGLKYAGLGEASNLSDVGEYIEKRQAYNMGGGSSIDIASMPLPLQLFSYLFRPLPLEIGGLFGLVTGIENVFLLGLFFYFARNAFHGHSILPAFPRYFLIIFSSITLVILALTTANLGIALRQKWMFMPMLLLLGFSYLPQNAYARYQEQVRQFRHRRFRHMP